MSAGLRWGRGWPEEENDVSQAPEGSRGQSHSACLPSRKAIPKSLKGEEKEKQARLNKEKSPVFASKVTLSPPGLWPRYTVSDRTAHHYTHTNKNVLWGGLWLLLERDAGPRMSLVTTNRYMRGRDDVGNEEHR